MQQQTVITIVGPTSAGKTATALEIAAHIPNITILSADSRQIYRFLDIGTAKPTLEERSVCPHLFIDIRNPDEYYSAGIYASEAEKSLGDVFAAGGFPLVVGGTGLYVSALFDGIFEEPKSDFSAVREELNKRLENEGSDTLYAELAVHDPASAMRYADKNPRRILRALEFFHTTGKLLSDHFHQRSPSKYRALYYGIAPASRDTLYATINRRCKRMWNNGLIEETERIMSMGYSTHLNSLNTVGYKEAVAFLQQKMTSELALEKIQQHTRNYAKRQLTWFRRNEKIQWLHGSPAENAAIIINNIRRIANS